MEDADRSHRLAERTWETAPRELVVIPIGSTEQHGPHLGLGTDTTIARAVADEIVRRARAAGIDAVATPTLPYGASGEHEGFAGTISMGTEALTLVLLEIGRSTSAWARRIVVVNGHGGNLDALRSAVPQLRGEHRDVSWLPTVPGPETPPGDLHAGRTETSLMLWLDAATVRQDRAVAGDTRDPRVVVPELREHGVAAVSPTGVLGDPGGASRDEGRTLLQSIAEHAWRRVSAGITGDDGMLRIP